jgi:hypothetical protein
MTDGFSALMQKYRVENEAERHEKKRPAIGHEAARSQRVETPAGAGQITERRQEKPEAVVHFTS